VPFFLMRFWESTAIGIYQRVFNAGFARRLERNITAHRWGYRTVAVDMLNYLTFALMFAGLYLANGSQFNPPITTPADAIYFSITTLTTLGYGDVIPLGCMRTLAAIQVLFGLFLIVLLIGVFIGRRVLYSLED